MMSEIDEYLYDWCMVIVSGLGWQAPTQLHPRLILTPTKLRCKSDFGEVKSVVVLYSRIRIQHWVAQSH